MLADSPRSEITNSARKADLKKAMILDGIGTFLYGAMAYMQLQGVHAISRRYLRDGGGPRSAGQG